MTTYTYDPELIQMLGGEPDDFGQLCELALLPEGECGTCKMQYFVNAYAARGDEFARHFTCDCDGHWSFA